MAEYPPETVAAAIDDLTKGLSLGVVARKHNIPRSTVQGWADGLKKKTGKSSFEVKQEAFLDAYADFGAATMRMLQAQAVLLGDPTYLRTAKTEDVIKHTEFIRNTFSGFQARHGAAYPDALPEPAEPECEVVDAVPV